MRITDEHIATYRRQGFVIVEDFLTEAERQAALDGFFTLFAPSYADYVANSGADPLSLGPLGPEPCYGSP